MDARLARALEVEAAQMTAKEIKLVGARLDRIEAMIADHIANTTPPANTRGKPTDGQRTA